MPPTAAVGNETDEAAAGVPGPLFDSERLSQAGRVLPNPDEVSRAAESRATMEQAARFYSDF